MGRKLSLSYDGTNQIALVTDPIGRQVQYTYNAFGTLETVTEPIGEVTRYDYSAANRLTQVTDARGVAVVQNTYNTDGRVIQQIHADGGVLNIAYTLANPGEFGTDQVFSRLSVYVIQIELVGPYGYSRFRLFGNLSNTKICNLILRIHRLCCISFFPELPPKNTSLYRLLTEMNPPL